MEQLDGYIYMAFFGYELVCNVFTAANVKSQLPLSGPRKQAAESPNAECTTVDILSG